MQQPGADADGPVDDDLADLLAPVDVALSPGPAAPPVRPRRAPEVETPEVVAPEVEAPAVEAPEVEAPGADALPVEDAVVVEQPLVEQPLVEPPAVEPPAAEDVVTFGRWFQPVPGGVLPRPSDDQPLAAVVAAPAGSTVHAITAGRVHRAPVTLAPGAVELAAADGSTLVLTGPATTTWFRDDEDVQAGEVLGVLPDDGGTQRLVVLVIGPDGRPLDAVDLLVGLPDPGELDLGAGLGTDPFLLDLEVAGRLEKDGAR